MLPRHVGCPSKSQRRALKRGGAATHVSTDDDATTADLSDARATPASVVEARDLADQLAGLPGQGFGKIGDFAQGNGIRHGTPS